MHNKITDKDRLEFILRLLGAGEDVFDITNGYEGDDEDQYFESARAAIDDEIAKAAAPAIREAMKEGEAK